jgi:hypothetical protein
MPSHSNFLDFHPTFLILKKYASSFILFYFLKKIKEGWDTRGSVVG